ncbi:hypothetical protein [Ferroplasma sp.]|uniref:hypothetical protein n=1 Tax=Ferroplasma sp. TaxID=2591003 RepID=UPI00307FB2B0
MDCLESNGWKVYVDLFKDNKTKEYEAKIRSVNSIKEDNNYFIKKKKFKHSFKGLKSIPLLHDSLNNVKYLALGFVYDSYGHLGFNRIEIRNNKAYIFIADKSYFKGKAGNIKVKIFNTCSVKYIIAASIHMEDKKEFLLKYDDKNIFCCGIIPENAYFIIDAEILREKRSFVEKISFGSEIIDAKMEYNVLKIRRIQFNKKECCGIIQGGEDHQFLYKLAIALGNHMGKI